MEIVFPTSLTDRCAIAHIIVGLGQELDPLLILKRQWLRRSAVCSLLQASDKIFN